MSPRKPQGLAHRKDGETPGNDRAAEPISPENNSGPNEAQAAGHFSKRWLWRHQYSSICYGQVDWLDSIASDKRISSFAFHLAYVIAGYDANGHALPDAKTLARELGITAREVRAGAELLTRCGYLRQQYQPGCFDDDDAEDEFIANEAGQ